MRRPLLVTLLVAGVALVVALVVQAWRSPRDAPPTVLAVAPATTAAAATARAEAGSPGSAPSSTPAAPLRLAPARVEHDASLAAGAFEGRVVSWASGRGVPGAELTFLRGDATLTVKAGKDGAFAWLPPEPGAYSLVLVTAVGYVPFAPEWGHSPMTLMARAGERMRDVLVYLSPEIEYAILVRDRAKQPIAGAELLVLGAARGGAVRSDAAGQARVVAADDAVIEARAAGYSTGRGRVDFAAQVSHRVVIELAARAGPPEEALTITGRVLDGRSDPLDGALVSARLSRGDPARPPGPGGPAAAMTSDDDGRFTLEDLEPGTYDLVASHRGLAPAKADSVAAGTRDVTLRLQEGASIRGVAREAASGAPVAAFTVLVWRKSGPIQRELAAQVSVIDAAGSYEVEGLPAGPHVVGVAAHGFAPAAEVMVEIPAPPAEPVRADFALGKGARVSGVVLEQEGGAPIEGARVSLEGRTGPDESAAPLLAATTTDAAGRFELLGLAAGLRSLTVAASGHHGRIVSGLVAGGEGDIGPITVELARTKDGEEPRLELTGIGAVLSAEEDALVIGQVIDGGGAKEAGLAPGDAIVSVDGVPVVDLGFEGAVQRIRGPEGSRVTLGVRRGGAGEVTEVTVVRRRVRS